MSTNDKLADALRNIVNMLREHPAMQGREYIDLGIAANNALRAYDLSLAAPPAQGEWVMVPRIPTPEMDAAGKQALSDNGIGDLADSDALICYAAMLAARPQPAPAPVQVDDWWRVEVSDIAGQIVAIELDTLSGREIGEHEEAVIREAIDRLRGFIGDRDQPPAPGETELPPLPELSIGTFRKKPVAIKAVQLTRENGQAVAAWCGGQWLSLYGRGDRGEDISHVSITTLEGTMRADLGDWIIRGVKGEFYPCKPDIFTDTYDAAIAADDFDSPEPGMRERLDQAAAQSERWLESYRARLAAKGGV